MSTDSIGQIEAAYANKLLAQSAKSKQGGSRNERR